MTHVLDVTHTIVVYAHLLLPWYSVIHLQLLCCCLSIRVVRHTNDTYTGHCPYHGDCLEGLANAPSLAARINAPQEQLITLPDTHEIFEYEAFYLGTFCATVAMMMAPEVIILGGGVLQRKSLFPNIRKHFKQAINQYLRVPKMESKFILSLCFYFKQASKNCKAAYIIYTLSYNRIAFVKHFGVLF